MKPKTQRPSGEVFLTFGDVRDWVRQSEKMNADYFKFTAHNAQEFGGWCVSIELRKHETCEPDEEAPDGQ